MADGGSPLDPFWRLAYRLGHPCVELFWQAMATPGTGSVIAVWHGSRLLCVRESYRRGLGLPGGGLNAGEAPRAAARRELFEEVGLDLAAEAFRPAGTIAFTAGRRAIEDTLFEVELDDALPLRVDRREIVWADYLPLDAIRAARLQPAVSLYLQRFAG